LEDFMRSSHCDNRLTAMSLAVGAAPPIEEIVQLIAEAKTVYLTATLHTQSLPDRVEQHRMLWKQAHAFF
jgi:hypothetical protein